MLVLRTLVDINTDCPSSVDPTILTGGEGGKAGDSGKNEQRRLLHHFRLFPPIMSGAAASEPARIVVAAPS